MGLCRSFEFTILRRLIAEKGGIKTLHMSDIEYRVMKSAGTYLEI